MNGIILINKPSGFTSFDVVAKMRGILKIKRIGHAGTLDPMATGVLPIFVGKATKACDIMPDSSKSYIAEFKLGAETDTQDKTGKITEEYNSVLLKKEDILAQLDNFRGEISQIPPMYSAVSVNGKRLYQLAREGKTVERPARKVVIKSLELTDFDYENQTGTMKISCSSGTYIRTLVSDIAKVAGSGAYLTSLVRTAAAGFDLEETITLEELRQKANDGLAESVCIPIERIFSGIPAIKLNPKQTQMYMNGVKLYLKNIDGIKSDTEQYTVYSDKNIFIGTAKADYENQVLRIGKNFI